MFANLKRHQITSHSPQLMFENYYRDSSLKLFFDMF